MKEITEVQAIEVLNQWDDALELFSVWKDLYAHYKNQPLTRDDIFTLAYHLFMKTGITNNHEDAYRWFRDNFTNETYPARTNTFVARKNRPKCPDCGKHLMFMELNTHPKTMVGGEWKSMAVCPDEVGCGYQGEYSKLTIREILKY